jgi:tRNA threonylcarbamoyladenosine biosynthesis protein TsaB
VIVLSIDTCDARGGVVLLRDDVALAMASHQSGEEDYSSWLLPAVGDVLAKARVKMVEVDAFGVATGPGSFTGSRIGLTTVKAWGEVYWKPIVGVSRLELIAWQAWGGTNYVASWTDARRGQVFGAVYRRNGDDLNRLGDEVVMAPGRFVSYAAEMARGEKIAWASPDADCVFDTEEWKARENLEEGFELVSGYLGIGIARMARKAVMAGQFTDALGLDANYVRRSDAEILWKGGAAHGH